MRGKNLLVGLFLVLLLLNVGFVSAEIMLNQPKAFYNLGESVNLEAQVSSLDSGFFKIDLVCGSDSGNIYNSVLNGKKVKIELPLTRTYIGNLTGDDCYFKGLYANEVKKGQVFEISDVIEVGFDINEIGYVAGEEIIAKGTGIKKNNLLVGQDFDAFVEIRVGSSGLKYTDVVKDGKFAVNFSLQENIKSGNYPIVAYVYEKDEDGRVLNAGESKGQINVKQELSRIRIAPNGQNFIPGDEIKFQILLYDQAEEEIKEEDVLVTIKNSKDDEIWKQIVNSGESVDLTLKNNSIQGEWKIVAEKDEISEEILFNVGEKELAEFVLENDTLIITNVGNVVYDESVEINVGGEIIIKDVDLKVGEIKRFSLVAPEGGYNVDITDGVTGISRGGVSLTGNVIGIKDLKSGFGIWTKYPIVWIFLIGIMALFVLMMVRKVVKKKSISYGGPVEKIKSVKKKIFDGCEKDVNYIVAEHSLVLNGHKQNAAIVAIKLKNKLSEVAEWNLEKAFERAYEMKAAGSISGNFGLLVFSPLLTNTVNNEVSAVKAAQGIRDALIRYNKQAKDKIDFGIGVGSGEIINKLDNGKLKFTGLGKVLIDAKRVAGLSNQEVLISKELHRKTGTKIMAEKAFKEGSEEVFRIKQIRSSDGDNKKFISEFLERLHKKD